MVYNVDIFTKQLDSEGAIKGLAFVIEVLDLFLLPQRSTERVNGFIGGISGYADFSDVLIL